LYHSIANLFLSKDFQIYYNFLALPFYSQKGKNLAKKRLQIITQIAKKPVERCSCKFYYYTVTRIHGGKDKKGLSICLLVTEKQPFENRSSQQLRSDHAALL
jgi:hypothetical protein